MGGFYFVNCDLGSCFYDFGYKIRVENIWSLCGSISSREYFRQIDKLRALLAVPLAVVGCELDPLVAVGLAKVKVHEMNLRVVAK